MTKHTPGPWIAELDDFTEEPTGWIADATGKLMVVQYAGCGSHKADWDEADLRLVLAAPELLEALSDLLAMCKRQTDFNDDGDGCMFYRCQAAIAKATGE